MSMQVHFLHSMSCKPRRVFQVLNNRQVSPSCLMSLLTLHQCSTIDHFTLSNSDADPLPDPLDDNRRTSACFVCSFLEWARQSSRTNSRGPSFVPAAENPRPSSLNTTTSSRSPTPVEEEAQRITPRPWFSFGIRAPVCGWRFLGPVSNKNLNLDGISLPCRDLATTSPV
jgi:hypothetical protein